VNVAVLGGGIMGSGIAQIAATVGDDAVVRDVDDVALERAAPPSKRASVVL
jgi:3-hydroxyacyl-CoA dehydrogenase